MEKCNPHSLRQFFGMALLALLLTACLPEKPVTEPMSILLFGDSLMAGPGIAEEKKLHHQLETLFHEAGYSGVKVSNMSISGETTAGGLSRIRNVVGMKPDIVILELGANDLLRRQSAEKAAQRLSRMIDTLQQNKITVMLAGVEIPAAYTLNNSQYGNYAPMYAGLAKVHYVAFHPNILKGVVGTNGMTQEDSLHPNEAGTAVIAANLFPQLKQVVRAKAAIRQ